MCARVRVFVGATETVSFELPSTSSLSYVTADGSRALYPGTHFLDVSNGNGVNITIALQLEGQEALPAGRKPPPMMW